MRLFWGLMGCGSAASAPQPVMPAPAAAAPAAAPVVPKPPPVRELSFVAVGDVLPHRRVKSSAAAKGWASVLGIGDRISEADLAFANLESPVAPDHHKGIHGEVFNAPASLVTGLKEAGFDVLSMANNHVWDQGVDGMLETRQRVLDAGMKPVGVGTTCAEAASPVVVERNGIRVAFVAWVDLLNADLRAGDGEPCVFVPGPLCKEDCLPDRDALFYRADPAVFSAAIKTAREQADVVVVSAHWGNEYRTTPLPEYPRFAASMVEAGADIVLGHHPHVLQPIARIEAGGRSGIVAYSLGNFVSDMGRSYSPDTHPARKGNTRDGGVLAVTIRVGETTTLDAVFEPTWTSNGETIAVTWQSELDPALEATRSQSVQAIIPPEFLPR